MSKPWEAARNSNPKPWEAAGNSNPKPWESSKSNHGKDNPWENTKVDTTKKSWMGSPAPRITQVWISTAEYNPKSPWLSQAEFGEFAAKNFPFFKDYLGNYQNFFA